MTSCPRHIRDELLYALHGSSAFRHFKTVLRHHQREKAWFAFRDQALRDIAAEWCQDEGIEYMDD